MTDTYSFVEMQNLRETVMFSLEMDDPIAELPMDVHLG